LLDITALLELEAQVLCYTSYNSSTPVCDQLFDFENIDSRQFFVMFSGIRILYHQP
jgi:hypothetical protein